MRNFLLLRRFDVYNLVSWTLCCHYLYRWWCIINLCCEFCLRWFHIWSKFFPSTQRFI